MKNNFKRVLSMILAVITVVGCVAFPVSATTTAAQANCDHKGWTQVDTVAPTCDKQGYELWYCTDCYLYEQREVTPKTDHDWQKMTEAKEPTCAADGYPAGSYICSNCSLYNEQKSGQALPAAYKKLTVCGTACASGHDVESDECIHTWGDPETEGNPCLDPTQTVTYNCECCDEKVVKTNTTGKHQYVYVESTLKAPTCIEAGEILRKCAICPQKETVKITKIDHTWAPNGDVDKASTTKVEGGATATNCGLKCTVEGCGAYATDTTKTHTFGTPVVVEAECGKKGSTTKTCTGCGYVEVTPIQALVHVPQDPDGVVIQEFKHTKTEQQDEITQYFCTVCESNYTKVTKAIKDYHKPPVDGNGDPIYTYYEETCEDAGFKVYQCRICMLIEKQDFGALGHKKTSKATNQDAYNCETGGYWTWNCTQCGGTWVDYDTPIAAQSHVWDSANGKAEGTPTHDDKGECGRDGFTGWYCIYCPERKGTVNEQPDHIEAELWYYGNGCVTDLHVYTYCTRSGCKFNLPEILYKDSTNNTVAKQLKAFNNAIANKTDTEVITMLDPYLAETSTTRVWEENKGCEGKHSYGNEFVLEPSTCKTQGWNGIKCERSKYCQVSYRTTHLTTFDPYNHEGDQKLEHFRWTCDRDVGEELYSTYYCAACEKHYDVATKIPKAGIKLTTDENNVPTGYILVDNITIYYVGVGEAKTEWVVGAISKEATSGQAHNYAYTTNAGCHDSGNKGIKTCKLCQDTIEGVTVDCQPGTKTYLGGKSGPTCAEPADWTATCKMGCNQPMTGTDPATGNHTYTAQQQCYNAECDHKDVTKCDRFKEITCTGTKFYKSCSVCGKTSKGAGKNKEGTFTKTGAGYTIPHTYDQKFVCNKSKCTHADITQCTYKVNSTLTTSYLDTTIAVTCKQKATYYYACKCGASSKDEADTTHPQYQAQYENGDFAECNTLYSKDVFAANNEKCVKISYTEVGCTICGKMSRWDNFAAAEDHVAKEYTGKQEPGKALGTGEQPYKDPTCVMLGYWYTECKYCGNYEDEDGFFFPIVINDGTVVKSDDGNGNVTYFTKSENKPHVNYNDVILTGNCLYVVDDLVNVDPAITTDKYECKVCDESIQPQHNYEAATTECGDRKCTICKEAVLEAEDEKHNYVTDTTSTKEGVIVDVCEVCGKVKETIIPAVTFSMDIANPNGSVIVNGGKAYLTINMDCVNATMHSVYLQLTAPAYLTNAAAVEKGALGGNVMVYQNGTNVTVFADVGTEREEVTVNGDDTLCVIEFTVNYDAWIAATSHIENNVKETEISFVEPADTNQIMVLNYAGEKVAFDVKENKTLKFNIDQIGDINNDGIINSEDARLLAIAINTKAEYNAVYDVNNDGVVNVLDYGRMMQYIVGILNYDHLVKNTEPTV